MIAIDESEYERMRLELWRLRSARGLSQREVAARAGTTDKTVGKWERGENMPSFMHFVGWAAALGWKVEVWDETGER